MAHTAFIDLSTGVIEVIPADEILLTRFLGGWGYGARLLFDAVGPQVDPLAPENLPIFSTGPLTGRC